MVDSGYYPSSQVGTIDSCSSCSGSGYGAAGYTSGYSSGMYDASYAAVNYGSYGSRGCFSGWKKRGGGLFSCFKKNRGCYAPTSYGCEAGAYDTSYSTPVFGSYTPGYVGGDAVYGSSQAYGSGQVVGSTQYTGSAQAPAYTSTSASMVAPVAADTITAPAPPAPAAPDAAPIPPAPAVDPTAPAAAAVEAAAEAVPVAPAPAAAP